MPFEIRETQLRAFLPEVAAPEAWAAALHPAMARFGIDSARLRVFVAGLRGLFACGIAFGSFNRGGKPYIELDFPMVFAWSMRTRARMWYE